MADSVPSLPPSALSAQVNLYSDGDMGREVGTLNAATPGAEQGGHARRTLVKRSSLDFFYGPTHVCSPLFDV